MKPVPVLTPSVAEQFWSKVERRGRDECWHWHRPVTGRARPSFRVGRTTYAAAQVALWLAGAVRGDGEGALHSCDNPRCCNPHHLRWGTQRENMRDKRVRGRTANRFGPARDARMRDWLENWTAF